MVRRDLMKSLAAWSCAWCIGSRSKGSSTLALLRAVIAANHASFLDGLLLGAFLPGDPIFAVDTYIAKQWWAKPFLAVVNAMPVDPANPLSIRAMIRAVERGSACIIFPEGRITTTGALMKVYEGPAVIAERTRAAFVPVRIDGVEFTPFSRLGEGPVSLVPRIRIRTAPAPAHTLRASTAARAPRCDGARRRDGGLDVCRGAHRHDALRGPGRRAAVHGGRHVIADDLAEAVDATTAS
jgi:acyl-[acyl-carrier-protein]-phospholipid O-acyltransferase/long-chain-fatty-acid--[acyl-carrier-protein] ligase